MTRRIRRGADGGPKRRDSQVRVFDSFDEENAAEHRRLAAMSPEERMREFGVLQGRHFGQSWGSTPIEKQVTWEKVSW